MAILAAATIACVGLRAQSLAAGRRIETRLAANRDTQAIFDMAVAGLLPRPQVDPETLTRRWQGDHLGHPFELTAERTTLPNPVYRSERADAAKLSDRIVMWRYQLSYRGRTTEYLWHQ